MIPMIKSNTVKKNPQLILLRTTGDSFVMNTPTLHDYHDVET